jgi:serine protease AprX
MRRLRLRLCGLTLLACCVALVPVASAGAAGSGAHVDPALTAAAKAVGPDAELHVIVIGRGVHGSSVRSALDARRDLPLIGGVSGTLPAKAVAALGAAPGIDVVTLDSPVSPTATSDPLSFPALATLYPQVDRAPGAWASGLTGSGVGVAVIDSGTTATADFSGRLTQVLLPGQTTAIDTFGHGSFVSGVVAGVSPDGRYVGVAPRASLYGIDVASAGGVYSSDVIAGLNWVAANAQADNIRVVNISLSENTAGSYTTSALDYAVEQVWRMGVVVVVSAGNLGPGTALYAPGNDPFAITVGALDANDTLTTLDDVVASFSSSGTTQDGFKKPEILAPGRRIVSVLPAGTSLVQQAPLGNLVAPGYAMMSGTSFSAPQVAAAAALLLQEHPEWTPDQVKSVLVATERPLAAAIGGALDVGAATGFAGVPGLANQGIAPSSGGSTDTSGVSSNTSSWNTSSWNTSSWNTSSWNTSSWNAFTWD